MPNRILREGILTSRRVDALSDRAELFYRRLMSRLDDSGRCEADVDLLRSGCYPLRVDKVKPAHIETWAEECRQACLMVVYEVGGKVFIQYLDWRQQERTESKCPAPPEQLIADAQQGISSDIKCSLSRIRSRSLYPKADMSGSSPDVAPPNGHKNGHEHLPIAKGILQFLNDKTGRRYQAVPGNLDFIVARLKDGATETELRQVVAKKVREWQGNPEMNLYLRPETLFNKTKFAQYQGELGNADGIGN